jgi:hypothetical protein
MNKIFKSCILSLLALAGLASCTDKYEYDAATVAGEQVYFSNKTATTQEISPSATSFSIPVKRIKTDGALTVPIKVTMPTGTIYTVPSSVAFADGKDSTSLVITYDPAKINYGEYDTITVAIDNVDYTTAYGSSSFTFTAGVTDWGKWTAVNSAGTATYNYSQFWSGTDPGVKIYKRDNMITPNKHQFRIDKIMYGVNVTLDYDSSTGIVTMDPTDTGYKNSTYNAEVFACDHNYYYSVLKGKKDGEYDKAYGSYNEKNGVITIPIVYYIAYNGGWGSFGDGVETIVLDGVDRKDGSVSVSYDGLLTNISGSKFVSTVKLGADATSANVALVKGSSVSDADLAAIKAGTYEGVQTITASGQVSFSTSGLASGLYTIAAVSFIDKDSISSGTALCRYTPDKWKTVGTGKYTYTTKDYTTSKAGGVYEGTVDAVLYQSESDATHFKISPWAGDNSEGLLFTVNSDNTITVEYDDTGDKYSGSEVYASDLITLGIANIASKVADGTYSFALAYHTSDGAMAYVQDQFVLSSTSSAAIYKAVAKAKKYSMTANFAGKTPVKYVHANKIIK